MCLADLFPSGKATTAACFLTICTSAVYSELKESNPEIELIDLFGKVGNAAFMVFEPKERGKIILEGWEMCRGLVANIKNNEDLKSWFARTYEGINLYVISDSGLSAEDKVVTDVLTPLYLNLCESRESWS